MCYTVLHLTASLQILTPSLLIYKVWPLSLVPMLVCDPWEMAGGQFGVISECVIWVWRRHNIFVLEIVTVYAPTNHADSSWEARLMLHLRPSVAGSWHDLPLTST